MNQSMFKFIFPLEKLGKVKENNNFNNTGTVLNKEFNEIRVVFCASGGSGKE